MNRFRVVASLMMVLGAGCVGPPAVAPVASDGADALAGRRSVVLDVKGLSCPLCSNNLDGQLRRIDGIERAVIDLQTGAVTVHLAEGHAVTRARLARAVADAGFTLHAVRTGDAAP
jgi:copper chaperone CopZ